MKKSWAGKGRQGPTSKVKSNIYIKEVATPTAEDHELLDAVKRGEKREDGDVNETETPSSAVNLHEHRKREGLSACRTSSSRIAQRR